MITLRNPHSLSTTRKRDGILCMIIIAQRCCLLRFCNHVNLYHIASRFIAEPIGTHWYHPHEGTQRSMGAFGALVVLPRTEKKAEELRVQFI